MKKKLRVAWVSPLEDRGLLSSYRFSQLMLPHLAEHLEIELFADRLSEKELFFHADTLSSGAANSGPTVRFPYFNYQRINERRLCAEISLFVYQLEDTSACGFVQLAARLWPGLGVFHDLSLNRLYASRYSHCTAAKDINAMMDEHFGYDAMRLGETFVRGWPTEVFEKLYSFGKAEQLACSAKLLMSRSFIPQVAKVQVPGGLSFAPVPALVREESSRFALREHGRGRLGIDSSRPVIAFLGQNQLGDRFYESLSAFSSVAEARRVKGQAAPLFLWPVRSASESQAMRLYVEQKREVLGSAYDLLRVVLCETWDDYWCLTAAADVITAMRFDEGRGGLPGVFDLLGMGAAMVLADSGATKSIPGECAIKLPAGCSVGERLAESLEVLLDSPELRSRLGSLAREYVRNMHSPRLVAEQFLEFMLAEQNSISASFKVREDQLNEEFLKMRNRLAESLDEVSKGVMMEALETLLA